MKLNKKINNTTINNIINETYIIFYKILSENKILNKPKKV